MPQAVSLLKTLLPLPRTVWLKVRSMQVNSLKPHGRGGIRIQNYQWLNEVTMIAGWPTPLRAVTKRAAQWPAGRHGPR